MILIIASNLDDNAALLKAKWPHATLLTVNDLTAPGWEIAATNFADSRLIAGGNKIKVTEVKGVINLLPVVMPYELFKIVPEDRKYVASELNAFLFYFLTKFQCPFLNRPSAYNLTGPLVRQEEWIKECSKVSLPVYNTQSSEHVKFCSLTEGDRLKSVSYLNNTVFGNEAAGFCSRVTALANNTGHNYFTIHFKEKNNHLFFHSVSTYPDFNDEQTLLMLEQYFKK